MTEDRGSSYQNVAALVEELKLEEPGPCEDVGSEGLWYEDECSDSIPGNQLRDSSLLHREWSRRHEHFHTAGYRDGLLSGKEASAQEGFNVGFKQSVCAGYRWGLIRGIASAFAALAEDLKDTLVETIERKERLCNLNVSVQAISSNDALKLFHESTLVSGIESCPVSTIEDNNRCNQLESHRQELLSILQESPKIRATTELL